MWLINEFESFYTDGKKDCFVNMLTIDVRRKRYMHDENVSDLCTDGYDEEGNYCCSTYVSSAIFDILLKGVKDAGFIKYVPEE